MSNKVGIISDIHFGVNKNSEMFLLSGLKFFKDQFVPYLKENGISTVLVLGDIFDNRNTINVRISDEVYMFFSEVLKDFNVTILIGNHDIYYKSTTEVHSLKALNHLTNVTVINDIMIYDVCGVDCLFCPWVVDYEDELFLDMMKNTDVDLLFGHFDIVGFALNATTTSVDGVSPSLFSNFSKVFSGHYHTPSSKIVNGTEIVYIGSPYQMNRNDINEDKGFIILDVETMEYERITNTESVKFVKVYYPDMPTKDEIEGNIVDIHININKNQLSNNDIDSFISTIDAMGPVEKSRPIMNVVSDDVDIRDVLDGGVYDIPDLLELYINENETIPEDEKSEILLLTMSMYDRINN